MQEQEIAVQHDWFPMRRRVTREVRVRDIGIGGANPLRIQSMLTCSTFDTAACVEQTQRLAAAGCEIVRLAAPTVRDAANLANIRAETGDIPLVADIHFKPEAAFEAAQHVDKIRINPGNYADRKMSPPQSSQNSQLEYDDIAYAEAIERARTRFEPLVRLCQQRGISMRIGVNHGSLSDRIMHRYGDTVEGMVESALEFTRFARDLGFHDLIFSMKASNVKIVIAAYRLLADRLDALGWDYPIHLGVTEAGDGEDGRIKSAIGIGALLADGIGDTLRVSLTEDSVEEIPVARAIACIAPSLMWRAEGSPLPTTHLPSPYHYTRRPSQAVGTIGGSHPVRILAAATQPAEPNFLADAIAPSCIEIDPRNDTAIAALNATDTPTLVTLPDGLDLPIIGAYRLLAAHLDPRHPILLKDTLDGKSCSAHSCAEDSRLASAIILGSLLCDGIGDAVLVRRAPRSLETAYNILQACGVRLYKTEYIACPSCGRTLFDLRETTARVKEATSHLTGLKIAVMGCIVNGPGEMADADFGYVGGAPGKINLYVGKTPVAFHIPQEQAVERLVALIKEHGRWQDPCELEKSTTQPEASFP